ncbi:hypothetical protein SAE01_01820 [Segetibacter aerophilus]|uniref:Uncharacterized protein n=2 Tax=Segetibacter aerophilus TaxID=670293 RepID=A0A512B6V9_9BACT|nr:hypothetical protein SAE01_01820 [Segetibacter aerophilus]
MNKKIKMNKQNNKLLLSAGLLIVAAAFTRMFPHAPNFTAVGAIAVFGGSVIKDKKLAFLMPLGALLLSDVCLQLFTETKGFYGTTQFFVYAAFIIITALSTFMQKRSVTNIALAAVWSGAIFFVLSNMGVWASSNFYPKSFAGLSACYAAAIPFYKNEFFGNFILNSIMGNVFYSALLFTAYAVMERKTTMQEAIA